MSHRRWAAGILAVGTVVGALAFFLLPLRLLEFDFRLEPSALVLIPSLTLALGVLGFGEWSYRRRLRSEQLLAEQIAALEEERRTFIGRLDHELKNPLTAIQVQLDNLQVATSSDVAHLRAQTDRLAQLTRGLRRLSDLETRPLEPEAVDLQELLEEVIELVQAADRIQLEVQSKPWSIPPISGDRELLLMAFRNLAENALIYSEAEVEVRARQASDQLLIEVIDTGRGIPAEDLPHVAEELFRGSNVHEIPGSGLGLAMVQRIVERHGGSLELTSRPGQGTIAAVQIPYESGKAGP